MAIQFETSLECTLQILFGILTSLYKTKQKPVKPENVLKSLKDFFKLRKSWQNRRTKLANWEVPSELECQMKKLKERS